MGDVDNEENVIIRNVEEENEVEETINYLNQIALEHEVGKGLEKNNVGSGGGDSVPMPQNLQITGLTSPIEYNEAENLSNMVTQPKEAGSEKRVRKKWKKIARGVESSSTFDAENELGRKRKDLAGKGNHVGVKEENGDCQILNPDEKRRKLITSSKLVTISAREEGLLAYRTS
ncbi:hypothetical protein V2J09_000134 [Rumex salicifolius]